MDYMIQSYSLYSYFIIMKTTTYSLPKVKNFQHLNQFTIENWNYVYFQSYQSLIASYDWENHLILWIDWDYSKTTLKHLYQFISEYVIYWISLSKKAIEKAIEDWFLDNWFHKVYIELDPYMK